MFDNIIEKKGNKFYSVEKKDVIQAQNSMGIFIPDDLISFYEKVGCGFLKSDFSNYNRIMAPGNICDFRMRQGQFANDPELEMYAEEEKDKLFFFEICEGYYLSIGFAKNNYGKIFDGNTVVMTKGQE